MVKNTSAQYIAIIGSFFCIASVTASERPVVQQKTAVQEQQGSVYCPELPCWSQAPCFQHTKNAQVRWHDAQRLLNQQILYLIGSYARSEHTHTIESIMPATMLTESNILPGCPFRMGQHFTLDDSNTTNIKKILSQDSKSTIASILLTDSSKKFFRRGKRSDEADYVPYHKSPVDGSLAIHVVGQGTGIAYSTMHLIPADNTLIQAGFLPVY